jgi:hypothetical protein
MLRSKIFISFVLLFSLTIAFSVRAQFVNFSYQAGRRVFWTWVTGSSTNNGAAVGTLGVASTSNTPMARGWGCSAVDNSGNFWLFGGDNNGKTTTNLYMMNDLWKYNPTTSEWTWVSGSKTGLATSAGAVYGTKGTPSTSNTPGVREDTSCIFDDNGYLWVFGGLLTSSTDVNDLWRFNPATLEWTWMTGSNTTNANGVYGTKGTAAAANTPGARERMGLWKGPNNTIWMFGGYVYDSGGSGRFNDLWKYDVATNQWTWMAGASTTAGATATYGTRGTPSTSNIPNGRRVFQSSTTIDSAGNFWLFGGDSGSSVYNNDLWRYKPSSGEWTWISGANTTGQAGVFGGLMVNNPSNHPQARVLNTLWVGKSDVIFLWGGWNLTAEMNDLWTYNQTTDMWTWLSGSSAGGASGVYGTIGVAAPLNVPSGRDASCSWVDGSGNLWLFGGEYGAHAIAAPVWNDLWKATVY